MNNPHERLRLPSLISSEYAEYLAKLMSDERLAWSMGFRAWKVARKYTWEKHAKDLLNVILSS